jgi:hypothetical protein
MNTTNQKNQFIEKQSSQIVASNKCPECKQNILVTKVTYKRPNGTLEHRTGEVAHYCDGGESAFIDAHEFEGLRQKAEAFYNFKEWA